MSAWVISGHSPIFGLWPLYSQYRIDHGAQMVMAGLWAKWKSPTSGEEVLSCTILTCEPNNAMGELQDMPVILAESDWPKWLGEEPASEQDLLA
jgi:putative SOS response-associated peptidase YedK